MEPAEGRAIADERVLVAPSEAAAGAPRSPARREEAAPGDPSGEIAPRLPRAPPPCAGPGFAARCVVAVARVDRALAAERDRGVPFLLVPVLLACGALAYFALPAEPTTAALVAAFGLTAASVALAFDRPQLKPVLVALLFVLAGMLFAKWETERAATPMIGEAISTVVTGRVTSMEQQASGRTRLTLEVVSTEKPTLRYAPERIRLSATKLPDGLAVGGTVAGPARLFPPSGPLRPGSYDFSFESFFDGIGANGFFLGSPRLAQATPASFGGRFAAAVERTRAALSGRIRERIGGAEGEIAAALIAGTRAGIPEEVNEALRRTGLAHVLSISGLHMALVAATVMGALRMAFAFFPGFSARRPVKKYAAGAALLAAAVYLFISGSAVAAERSFLMLAIMLVALLFDRAAITMRNLAIAAIVVLVVSPHEVVGPSFQMSFAATAALIGAYAWWAERRRTKMPAARFADRTRLSRVAGTIVRYALGLAATSLVAGAATTIYGAWHFQRVSPLSLAANLAAMPIVSVAVMPPAVLAMAAMPFGLDGPFLDVMGRGIAALVSIADWFSQRTPVDAVGAVPVAAVLAATAALLIATLSTTWLRALALPFVVVAAAQFATHRSPELLVAENGGLLAVPLSDGRLALNRNRPNLFAVEDWMRATRSEVSVGPGAAEDGERPVRQFHRAGSEGEDGEGAAFACAGGTCLARSLSGAIVARVEGAALARDLCRQVQLIVVADATAGNPCAEGEATVITQRDLALRGSATMAVTGDGDGWRIDIAHAVDLPLRPWHDHRRFSRAARGLPPYEKSRRTVATRPTGLVEIGAQSVPSTAAPGREGRIGDGQISGRNPAQ